MSVKDTFTEQQKLPLSIVVLGAGGAMGQAGVEFLAQAYPHAKIYAGDYNDAAATKIFAKKGYSAQSVSVFHVNAMSPESITDSFEIHAPNIVVSTLPAGDMAYNAAFCAAQAGVSYVSSNFLDAKAIAALDEKVKALGITDVETFDEFLKYNNVVSQWGMGLDPGSDSFILRRALTPFTVDGATVTSIKLVGAGISDIPDDVYVKTWSKVTSGMGHRDAQMIKDGAEQSVKAKDKLSANARAGHETITLYSGETIETFLNNDGALALKGFASDMGADVSQLDFAANMTGRRVGHSDLWYSLIHDLDIMNNEKTFDDAKSMKDLLVALIIDNPTGHSPHLQDLANHIMAGKPTNKDTLAGVNDWTKTLSESGFFDDDNLPTREGIQRTAQDITEAHLERIYERREGHPDRSIVYVEVLGMDENGAAITNTVELNSVGDQALSGMTSMQKTVSGTLAKTAGLILEGEIPNGLHAPEDHPEIGERILESHINAGLITVNTHNDAPRMDVDYAATPT